MANDQKAFDTSDIIGSTRTTTVITPDSVIANKEHTQSIAIQNPNGGVGVGLTSINVQPTGLGKAKFNPNKFYETTNQTTSLATNKETSNNAAINPTTVANVQPVITSAPAEIIPLANKAVFQDKPSLDPAIINKASEKSEFVDVNEMKVINNADTVKAKAKTGKYVYPPIDLLSDRTIDKDEKQNKEVCDARVETINACLNDFKIGAQVVSYTIGPAVTRFDLKMNSNESCKVVDKYVDDISSRLNGVPCRFVQIVPGKTTSGIEIANKKASIVNFKDLLEHLEKEKADGMMIPFGKSISGDYIEADFTDFPHLLVCGTTGSGKSIFMHSLLMTLMMRNKLSDIRFIIIDPKRVEFGKYDKCPFLLCPPISDEIEANYVLQALVDVMEERYDMLLAAGLENVKQYNKYAIDHNIDIFPRIVVVIDEYADLVNSNKTISDSVVRLAQKARAAGIHLIISTQNPSVNIITGTIKANIPVRVALLCSSYTHSITILGTAGAEKLLGRGDMIVRCSFVSKNGDIRVQGAFVDNTEIRNVLDFIKANNQCDYDERFCDLKEKARLSTDEMKTVSYDKASSDEEKYQQIRDDIMSREYCSISFIQRSYGVGFPRAGKIFERLVSDGVISPSDEAGSNRGRKVILRNNSGSNAPKGSIEQSTFTADKKG
jgi:DNA segregation ATPase FtsK/SpoIIIE and related proteins